MIEATTLLLWLLVILLVAGGLVGVIVPALPGVPMLMAGLWLAAWIDDFERVGALTLWLLFVLTVVAVIVDFLAGMLGAKRVGASPQAIWGSLIGSVVGLVFGLLGLLMGPFVGAVIGELMARSNGLRATEVGVATWIGLLIGTVVKLAITVIMLGVFLFAWFG